MPTIKLTAGAAGIFFVAAAGAGAPAGAAPAGSAASRFGPLSACFQHQREDDEECLARADLSEFWRRAGLAEKNELQKLLDTGGVTCSGR